MKQKFPQAKELWLRHAPISSRYISRQVDTNAQISSFEGGKNLVFHLEQTKVQIVLPTRKEVTQEDIA